MNMKTAYKTDNKVLLSFIFYDPLHVSIYRDHHQVVSEYISVIIALSVKMYPFLHLIFMLYMVG
jgi:hypothetical protein